MSRALSLGSEYYRSQNQGKWPIKWYALECLYEGKFTHETDVWSFGVTAWEVVTYGQKPFADLKGREVLQLLERGDRLRTPPDCPPVSRGTVMAVATSHCLC